MKKSLFVVIEGIDRSGKSSLARTLKNTLTEKGYRVHLISFPNRENQTGKLISSVLSGEKVLEKEAMHLLFSANRWEDKSIIETLLSRNENAGCNATPSVILCDRYILSGVSYSMANGLSEKFSFASDKGMIEPDLTLFLNVSPETAEKRAGFGVELYERRELQEKVYVAMKKLLEKYEHKLIPSKSQEEMHAISLDYILDLLK
ncbi:dTMP kinase [Nematocida minor]|uniref:dTMP kinase n=1 Tax=Nematocida minor TaxID=1912983 RepID=UPI00221FAB8A|nr:dTMP kinase [Nematocida minor]KAI5189666.1 dTMP kinase [Nematocida minor]